MTAIALRATGLTLESGLPQQFGLALGLFGGVVGGYFNRTATFVVSSTNPAKLVKSLEEILVDMGYGVSEEDDLLDENVSLYQRSGLRAFFSGNVFIQVETHQITVAARSISLKRIQSALDEVN